MSKEVWDTVEDVEPEKKQPKIRTRGEKINFQMQSHKGYWVLPRERVETDRL